MCWKSEKMTDLGQIKNQKVGTYVFTVFVFVSICCNDCLLSW